MATVWGLASARAGVVQRHLLADGTVSMDKV